MSNKSKYVLHYQNLQLYLQLRMKLTKIHKVLLFKQSQWLRSYINYNTKKREKASNSFGKDFFKLMNNSVLGITMENLKNRIYV